MCGEMNECFVEAFVSDLGCARFQEEEEDTMWETVSIWKHNVQNNSVTGAKQHVDLIACWA